MDAILMVATSTLNIFCSINVYYDFFRQMWKSSGKELRLAEEVPACSSNYYYLLIAGTISCIKKYFWYKKSDGLRLYPSLDKRQEIKICTFTPITKGSFRSS